MYSMNGYVGVGADSGATEMVQVGPYSYLRVTKDVAGTILGALSAYRIPPPSSSVQIMGGAYAVQAVPGPGPGTALIGHINEMADKGYAPTITEAGMAALIAGTPVTLMFFPDTALPELIALNAGASDQDAQLVVLFDPPSGWQLQDKKPAWKLAGIGVVGWSAIGVGALGLAYFAKRRRRRAA